MLRLIAVLVALSLTVAVLWLERSWEPYHQAQTPQSGTNQESNGTRDQRKNSRSFGDIARDWTAPLEETITGYLQETSKYCANEGTEKEGKWLQDFLCGVKITDVVIAIFSVFLVFVTVGLLIVGWIQASLLRKTARRQLRAYVFVESAIILNVTTPLAWEVATGYKPTGAEITNTSFGPFVRMQIKNSGQTPAYDVLHWGELYFREFPLRSRLAKPSKPAQNPAFIQTKSSMPPNGTSTKNLLMTAPLTADQVADLKRGTGAIYVDGYISYRDAFRKKRKTNFRLLYGVFTGGIGITTELTIADHGNEAS